MSENPDAPRPAIENKSLAASQILLDYAHKAWQAEEENAARLHRERQVSVTILLGSFGAGFAATMNLLPKCEGWCYGTSLGFLGVGTVCYMAAFAQLLQTRTTALADKHKRPAKVKSTPGDPHSATVVWGLPTEILRPGVSEDVIAEYCGYNLYRAFLTLQGKNADIKANIRKGAVSLVSGLTFGIIGVIILLLAQNTATPNPDLERSAHVTQHESAQTYRASIELRKSQSVQSPESPGAASQRRGSSIP